MSFSISKRNVTVAVAVLLALQILQIAVVLRNQSLTFDEPDHMYAGYRMWKNGDYGLNPEHPPLVKLLATLPALTRNLWVPPLKGIFFKKEAWLDSQEWLSHNDNGSRSLIFRMRMTAALFAVALSLVVFFATREWFGTTAALVALTLVVFDPDILGHSGLVTTDVGATLFFLATLWTFYRFVKQPCLSRLAIAGLVFGLLLATKHSGVLMGPFMAILVLWETAVAAEGTRLRTGLRLSGAFAAMVVIAVGVLWAFYGFRYAARPAGLALIPSLDEYLHQLKPSDFGLMWWMAHLHLLPESYLMGMADIRISGKYFPTYLLGTWYRHGILWYFPVTIAIKATLGLIGLVLVCGFAIVTRKLGKGAGHARALVYVLVVGTGYLAIAMVNGLNIGVRHVLPLFALAAVVAGAGVAALAPLSRKWKWVCGALIAAHVVSALLVLPSPIAYANEAWGGPRNTYKLLSDSNVDWGQELYLVKDWEDKHPGEECWFAYMVRPFILPETYGVHCHILPNGNGGAGEEPVPAIIHGTVLLSASELNGSVWPTKSMNPYLALQARKPDELIGLGVMVYRGDIPMQGAGGVSRALLSYEKLQAKKTQEALTLGEDAVKLAPDNLFAQLALADAAAAVGKKDEARAAYNAAAVIVKEQIDPQTQDGYLKYIADSLKKL